MTLSSPLRSSGNWIWHFPLMQLMRTVKQLKERIIQSLQVKYSTEDGRTTSVAHWLEEDDFRNNGGVMNHEMVDGISKRRKPFTVDYTGFGWVLIKNGVFENEQMKYPWFTF